MRKNKTKKPEISKKASRQIVKMLYLVKRETGQWNIRETSRRLDVNQKYISENIRFGIEPTNLEIRHKMGLSDNECPACHRKIIKKKSTVKKVRESFIVEWGHLLKDERHKVIKEYLAWRKKS